MNVIATLEKIRRLLRSDLFLLVNRHRFAYVGKLVRFYSPLKVDGYENIYIKDNARIGDYSWLAALPLTGNDARLEIGENSMIGHFNHIYCTHSIKIENDVLTADKVYISDNAHSYTDISIPIWRQPIKQLKDVVVGEGSWIGENVCICGASIGKHCVIGANSVVTHDIPDYSIAAGIPARIIKTYNFEKNLWEKV